MVLKHWQLEKIKIILETPGGHEGFPDGSVSTESACNAGDPGSISRSGRSTGEAIGYPLQYTWASLVAQLVKNKSQLSGVSVYRSWLYRGDRWELTVLILKEPVLSWGRWPLKGGDEVGQLESEGWRGCTPCTLGGGVGSGGVGTRPWNSWGALHVGSVCGPQWHQEALRLLAAFRGQ